jgi:hypothetical protein
MLSNSSYNALRLGKGRPVFEQVTVFYSALADYNAFTFSLGMKEAIYCRPTVEPS